MLNEEVSNVSTRLTKAERKDKLFTVCKANLTVIIVKLPFALFISSVKGHGH